MDELDLLNEQHAHHPDPADEPARPEDDTLVIEIEDMPELLNTTPAARPLPPGTLAVLREHRVMSADAIFRLPPIEWFLEPIAPFVPQTMLHGAGGSFKSFLMLDWMLCAATGREWQGHTIRPGRVMYMAGEGVQGIPKRVRAWLAHHSLTIDALTNIDFMGAPINLASMKDESVEVWRSFFAELHYDYLVIDTLHTASIGAEENSATEMGRVLARARYIAGDTAVFYVHHRPKDKIGARGSGSLRDDIDVALSLGPSATTGLVARLEPDKIRDAEPFRPLALTFEQWGEGLESSLFIAGVSIDMSVGPDKPKPPTAVDKAVEAITKHDMLALGFGAGNLAKALKELDLGYNFSEATVGRALERLRAKEHEVADLLRNQKAGGHDATSD